MIKRLKALFADHSGTAVSRHSDDELQVAAAALMVEAAQMDDSFDGLERAKVMELLTQRFDLTRKEAETLLKAASDRVAESSQLFGFTRVIQSSFSHEERVELMEMLWEVVYIDGALHDLEASLMRRVSGLLHISDRESGAARKQALRRLDSSPDQR